MFTDFKIRSLRSLNPDNTTYTTIPWYFAENLVLGRGGYSITLTIEPGADIIMAAGTHINVQSDGGQGYTTRLIAKGNDDNPITIRGLSETSIWDTILIGSQTLSGRSIISYCNITGGGSSGRGLIAMTDSGGSRYLEIDNTTLKNSQSNGYGIYLDTRYSNVLRRILSTNPNSVTFVDCPGGNIGYRPYGSATFTPYTLSAYPEFQLLP